MVARVVPQNGIDDQRFTIDCVVEDTRTLGYTHIAMKSDQEPAIIEVQKAVIALRGDAVTVPVNSPVGDPASTGRVEDAVKRIRSPGTLLNASSNMFTEGLGHEPST